MENKVTQIVFSPAGTTKKIADAICSNISEYTTVDISKEVGKIEVESSQTVVVAAPVWRGRIPATAKDIEKAGHFGKSVKKKLDDENYSEVNVPGNPDYKNKKAGNGMAPKTSKSCNSCRICAKNCPVQAIPESDPRNTNKSCIGCMRCVAVCPKKARNLGAPVRFIVGMALSSAKKTEKQPETFL